MIYETVSSHDVRRAGEVLNKDDFPEAIWGSAERAATTSAARLQHFDEI